MPVDPGAKNSSSMDPKSIVERFLAAQAARDSELSRTFLADRGFTYQSPIASFQSADDFIQYVSFSDGIIQERQIRKVFVDGHDICHFLTYRIQLSEKQSIDAAQWAQVQDGRIARIEVLFDASAYRELFNGGLSA